MRCAKKKEVKKRKMKTGYIAPIAILVLVLAVFSTPAMAVEWLEPLITRDVSGFGSTTGTIINGTVMVLDGGPGNANWSFQVPDSCELVIAYAHWHKWAACPGDPTACFRNATGEYCIKIWDGKDYANDNISGAFCSGYSPENGTHHYFWRIYPTPGENWLNLTGCYGEPPNTVYGKWVVIVMTNCTNPQHITHSGQWWHNWGFHQVYVDNPYKTYFYNANSSSANYTLWSVQSHFDNGADLYFGGQSPQFETHLEHVTEWFEVEKYHVNKSAQTTLWEKWDLTPGDASGYMYVYTATLAEEAPTPDLEVTIEFIPETPRPNQDFTVNVTVENTGGLRANASFNVSLYIDGSLFGNRTINGLDAHANETVTFTSVNLPYGCHNFTAVADPEHIIENEPDTHRNDNSKSVYYQVGYVLVVKSDSDFDALVNESKNGTFGAGNITKIGNTYYIQNFRGDYAIENCAGHGIWIQDTTVPFVITNCTVHNCGWCAEKPEKWHGIYLNHLRGQYQKEIVDCTVANNSGKGIRVQNSTYVNISDCLIKNNSAHGIEVYPREVGGGHQSDSMFINITNNTIEGNHYGIDLIGFNCTVCGNTISNNAEYGIYIFGNYSCIYKNTIVNNSMYGMKLFNASHNIIFWNDFIDNNKTNPEYPEHQAYDMWEGQPGLNPQNHWNSTISDFVYKHSGTGSGGSNVSYMGNYWDNDTCTDANNDGICDSVYKIDGATAANDYYPLKEQWQNYTLMCGDVDASGEIKYKDVARLKKHYFTGYALASEWAGDVDCSGEIKYKDVARLKKHYFTGYALHCCTGCESAG